MENNQIDNQKDSKSGLALIIVPMIFLGILLGVFLWYKLRLTPELAINTFKGRYGVASSDLEVIKEYPKKTYEDICNDEGLKCKITAPKRVILRYNDKIVTVYSARDGIKDNYSFYQAFDKLTDYYQKLLGNQEVFLSITDNYSLSRFTDIASYYLKENTLQRPLRMLKKDSDIRTKITTINLVLYIPVEEMKIDTLEKTIDTLDKIDIDNTRYLYDEIRFVNTDTIKTSFDDNSFRYPYINQIIDEELEDKTFAIASYKNPNNEDSEDEVKTYKIDEKDIKEYKGYYYYIK